MPGPWTEEGLTMAVSVRMAQSTQPVLAQQPKEATASFLPLSTEAAGLLIEVQHI